MFKDMLELMKVRSEVPKGALNCIFINWISPLLFMFLALTLENKVMSDKIGKTEKLSIAWNAAATTVVKAMEGEERGPSSC